MKRLVPTVLAVLAGCAWSNSLYQARVLSREAASAEHDKRPFEAQQLWAQVIQHAESAYARAPRGKRGAEALWLAGHAAARSNDCARAVPALQDALLSGADRRWRSQLLLELGQCDEANGGPAASAVYGMLMASSSDPEIRRRARIRQGHVLVMQGHWAEGLAALEGEDTLPARLDRAMALAELGRTDRALVDLAPFLAARDTSVRWIGYVDAFAAHGSADTDALLNRLLAFPDVRDEQRSLWLLTGARSALALDPPAADRRLSLLTTRPLGPAVVDARLMQIELGFTRAASAAQVHTLLDSLRHAGDLPETSSASRVAELQVEAQRLIAKNDSTPAGSVTGDLTMFALAEFARDTLRAPRLASWFFARIEHDWRGSPYLAKALMARAAQEPDSAEMLLSRARQLVGSDYVAAANGSRGAQARVLRLEDSLGRFIAGIWGGRPRAARGAQERE